MYLPSRPGAILRDGMLVADLKLIMWPTIKCVEVPVRCCVKHVVPLCINSWMSRHNPRQLWCTVRALLHPGQHRNWYDGEDTDQLAISLGQFFTDKLTSVKHAVKQVRRWVGGSWVAIIRWVTWVMGHWVLTHDPSFFSIFGTYVLQYRIVE